MSEKLKKVARSSQKKNLLDYLEDVKREVADIRNPFKVKPEIEREVRLAVCDVIDELIIEKIKRYAEDLDEPYNEFR